MKGPINIQDLIQTLYGRTQQPLQQRGPVPHSALGETWEGPAAWVQGLLSAPRLVNALAPLGRYEDGSEDGALGLAVPEIIKMGYDGVRRFGEHGYGDDALQHNTEAAFDAAGLALTGSLGLGLVGGLADNAVGSAGARLTGNALERAGAQPQGIRAYHGSPHDFDRFDLSKIGTGEGAQAYGYGLYFAEAEDVARYYRDALTSGKTETRYNGNAYNEADPTHIAAFQLSRFGGDRDAAIELLSSRVNRYPNANEAAVWKEAIDVVKRGAEAIVDDIVDDVAPGKVYEVNIKANPEDFLDWDKSLAEQPRIAEIAQRLAPDVPLDARQLAAHTIHAPEFRQALIDAGIPGIRYLDGMSRGAREGSSNYVVFDDALIDILRKYANAPTGAVVPAGMAAAEDDDQSDLMALLRQYGIRLEDLR